MTTSEHSLANGATKTSRPMPKLDSIAQQEQKWESFVKNLWRSEEYEELRCFLRRTLIQFGLDGIRSETDIIFETDKITIRKIQCGEQIGNLPGWFRRTAFNVIRNFTKEEDRQGKLSKKLSNRSDAAYYPEDSVYENFSEEQLKTLYQSWNKLSKIDQRILILKEVKDFSWTEVGKQLIAEGLEIDNSRLINRIKKRGSRAKKQIRDFFEKNFRETQNDE